MNTRQLIITDFDCAFWDLFSKQPLFVRCLSFNVNLSFFSTLSLVNVMFFHSSIDKFHPSSIVKNVLNVKCRGLLSSLNLVLWIDVAIWTKCDFRSQSKSTFTNVWIRVWLAYLSHLSCNTRLAVSIVLTLRNALLTLDIDFPFHHSEWIKGLNAL